jgi:hypothetical protein
MTEPERPPPINSGNTEVDKLLKLAEDIQAQSEHELGVLARYRTLLYFILLLLIVTAALVIFLIWRLGDSGNTLIIPAIGGAAGITIVSGIYFYQYRQQQRRVMQRLDTNHRALFELMQLLDEVQSAITDTWSPFEKAQFKVRLARLWMLPSPSFEVNWEPTALASEKEPEISLSGTYLSGAKLGHVRLPLADISKATLRGADLEYANLQRANLTDAMLDETRLIGADLEGTDLTRASLTFALLMEANLTGANLTNANLEAANLTDAQLRNANLANARLLGAQVSYEQLAVCRSLTNAVMPDGSRHE